MPHSKPKSKPDKPHPDFPLFCHKGSGRWCKKVRGKLVYLGYKKDDPDGQIALGKWLDQKDELLAGRKPRPNGEYLTVVRLVDHFLHHKKQLAESSELAQRTWDRYKATGDMLAEFFGRTRPADDVRQDDFQALRANMAKRWGPIALGNEIQIVRSIFRYGVRSDLLPKEPKYGVSFDKPSAKTLRMTRTAKGPKMFTADQIKAVMNLARPAMKAMILLGINGGLGNTDVAELTAESFDLECGWLDYGRAKTGMPRRIPLWPETVTAVREAVQKRREPKSADDATLLFIGARGDSYVGNHKGFRVTAEFSRLLKAAGVEGRSFYDLRRTFQTIAEEKSRDLVAVKAIMGHAPSAGDMSAIYRQRVTDERLREAADGVRGWLYPPELAEATTKG